MLVKEAMSKNPIYLSPTATVKDAAEKMVELDCGFIPIGENDRLIGAVTDRDIVIRAVGKDKDSLATPLRDIMTKNVIYCYEDDQIHKAIEAMSKNQIHRVIVLNKDKRFTGVVSLGDIARKSLDPKLCGEAFLAISQKS
jgi:CBS domain-containing protein